MNNEPVAWMELYKGKPNQLYWEWDDCKNKGYWTSIPLYTHPAKELTDKEILEEWDWDSGEILAINLLDFADAILRKAQE